MRELGQRMTPSDMSRRKSMSGCGRRKTLEGTMARGSGDHVKKSSERYKRSEPEPERGEGGRALRGIPEAKTAACSKGGRRWESKNTGL